jgi:uncharacterized membrane protein (UPF0127 family)
MRMGREKKRSGLEKGELTDWRVVALVMAVSLFAVAAGACVQEALSYGRQNFELSNLSKKKSERVHMEVANTGLSHMRGLMFRGRIIPILFEFGYVGRFPIHSYFVVGEFDAIYLSKDGTVVEAYRKIPPSTALVSPQRDAAYLIELPPELTDRLKIEEGDRLEWKEIG